LQLGCVRTSVRPQKDFFPDFDLIWCVGRRRPDIHISVTSTRSKVKVTELVKLRKLHFSRSISFFVLAWSSKLMVVGDSMGPLVYSLWESDFQIFFLWKPSREFKLCGMSIFHEIQMAIFR